MTSSLSKYSLCTQPSVHIDSCTGAAVPNTHLVEVLLPEVRDGFVNLQVVGQFHILRAFHHVHAPGAKGPSKQISNDGYLVSFCFRTLKAKANQSNPDAKEVSMAGAMSLAAVMMYFSARTFLFATKIGKNRQRNVRNKR